MKHLRTILFTCAILFSSTIDTSAQWTNWQWQNVPLQSPFNTGYFLGIHFLKSNPRHGWICGRSTSNGGVGYVMRTLDGGKTWSGSIINNAPQLESIIFLNDSVGYCSGTQQNDIDKGGIYRSTNGGVSWTEITPKITEIGTGHIRRPSLWGCNFIDELNGCVIGGGCDGNPEYFFRTNDGGKSWKYFLGNTPSSGLSHVRMLDVAGTCYASSSGLIWKSSDGGYTWRQFSTTGPAYWQENLKLINNSFCVATSGNSCQGEGDGIGDIRFSTNLGQSWTRTATGAQMYGTFMLNDSTAWAAGLNRRALRTSNSGKTWTSFTCGLPDGVNLDDLFFINDTTGFIIGEGVYRTIKPQDGPALTIQGDTVFCEGDSVVLRAPDNYSQYVWNNGQVGQYLTVRQSGRYWVTLSKPPACPIVSPAVNVTVLQTPISNLSCSRSNRHLCYQDSVILSVQGSFRSVLWSTSQTSDSIVVRDSGRYYVRIVGLNGCIRTDSIDISGGFKRVPKINSKGPLHYCEGDSLLMVADDGYNSYLWSTGAETKSIFVGKSGRYWLMAQDSFGCVWSSDTVDVQVDTNPIIILDRPNNLMIIDSTNADLMNCDSLFIQNGGTDTLIIPPAVLLRNLEFSAPPAQFDLRIAPGERLGLQVCYRPSQLFTQRDTMIIGGYCHRVLYLQSAGVPNSLTGNGGCNIPLQATTQQIGTRGLVLFPAYPNPANNSISVPFMVGNGNQSVKVELLDMVGRVRLGREVEIPYIDNNQDSTPVGGAGTAEQSASKTKKNRTLLVELSVETLAEGPYLLHIQGMQEQDTQLIIIRH